MMTHKYWPCWLLAGLLLPLLPAHAADAPGKGKAADPSKAADASGAGKADAGAGKADDGTLTPDRPGFTNGGDTVAPGHIQIEVGISRTKYAAANGLGQATDAPQVLLRTGLNAKTELRVTLPDYIWPSGGAAGFGDGAIGIRYKFYQSKDGNTKLAFTPSLSVPLRSARPIPQPKKPVGPILTR